MIHATLYGQMVSGKNAVKINRTGRRYPANRFKAWRARAMGDLLAGLGGKKVRFTTPCRLLMSYTPGDARRRDVPGMEDAICHLLEKAGIVADDVLLKDMAFRTRPINRKSPQLELWLEVK